MSKKEEIKDYYDPSIYCPICGNPLVEEQGLTVCYYCGFSEDDLENDTNI